MSGAKVAPLADSVPAPATELGDSKGRLATMDAALADADAAAFDHIPAGTRPVARIPADRGHLYLGITIKGMREFVGMEREIAMLRRHT